METDRKRTVPKDFRYIEVLRKGMPEHEKTDPFRIRHPRMKVGHRAKIFAPFDALKGFNEALEEERKRQEKRTAPGRTEETGDSDVYTVLY